MRWHRVDVESGSFVEPPPRCADDTPWRKRNVVRLLGQANALESEAMHRVNPDDALRERREAALSGHAVSWGTSVPGAAALAVLLPVPPGHEPMTLSLGGPIAEIEAELARLLAVLRRVIEPFQQATHLRPRPALR